MGFFGFLILAAVAAMMWRRIGALERQIEDLRGSWPAHPPVAAPTEARTERPNELAPERATAMERFPAAEAPAPEPVPALSSEETQPADRTFLRFDFEDLFGRLLPIWAGGVTLAVAGFFLVRWSIDAGLLTPAVRVALAALFGVALVAGAEFAYRWRERVADPRVAQALAGAGLATLYAAFYLAGTAYGLIGSTLAFLGLAGVTAAAIALSFRFGLPSAVLGLVGGFAAPALVGREDANLPLLILYLALVTGGLAMAGRRQDRPWLGMAGLAGGLGWGALLLTGASARSPEAYILGGYLVFLGAVVPVLSGGSGRPHWMLRVAAAGLAALQLAVLVQQGGFGTLEWGLYLMLGAALAWFGWREAAMREANAVAAAVGIALLPFWANPSWLGFAGVAGGLAAIFAGVPLAQLSRGHGRSLDVAQATGTALGLALATLGHFGEPLPESPAPAMALALLLLACLPAAAAWLSRTQGGVPWPVTAQAVAALIAFAAVAQVLPQDTLAWAAAAAAGLIAWRARSLVGALGMLAALAALWALEPLSEWLEAGMLGLAGVPVQTAELPPLREVGWHLLPTVAAGVMMSIAVSSATLRRVFASLAMVVAVVAAHVLFRHGFSTIAGDDFVATGVIQRAMWEALLLATAWLAWTRGWRWVAIAVALVSLAHFAWFALVLHNPLWSEQAVGPLPIANALLPAYAAGLGAMWSIRRWSPGEPPILRWLIDGGMMIALAFLALSMLRQAFSGSLLTAVTIGEGEDLLRSLSGIVLAIGFLLRGARTGERSWRIGSLVLMVIAVLKVFLVDAAGLAGLARIASFMALGFSLIGIGWFYNRQLRGAARPPDP